MTTLIILRGNSGSGKTTVANALQKELGPHCLLLSQDVIRREMLYVKDGPETPAISLLTTLLRYGKKHCSFIILEGILRSEWYAPLFETITQEFPILLAYYYDLPFLETVQRHQTKKEVSFNEDDMKQWWKEQDTVSQLNETILTKQMSVDEVLKKILFDITNSTKSP